MTGIYEIHKANRIGRANDFWTALVAQKWRASEEEFKEYTGSVPVTINANGSPLISWRINGNTVQSGTPTPGNPIMPHGTGERTGNLAKYWKAAYVAASGTVNANRVNGVSFPVKIEAGQTVCFTNQKTNYGRGIAVFSGFDGETLTDMVYRSTNNTVEYTADNDCYVIIWGNYDNTTSMDKSVFALCGQMLNLGSTALPYEPYGYKIPISSAGQTTPIYLGEVETTRKIRKLVLDGTENWVLEYTDNFLLNTSIVDAEPLQLVVCTHQQSISTGYESNTNFENVRISQTKKLNFRTHTIPHNLSDFKSYLAQQYVNGTPVCVWYVLTEPETAVVNEPLMKIGDYADEVSNAATIPINNGSTTINVDTEVKPSEVYIKYKSR